MPLDPGLDGLLRYMATMNLHGLSAGTPEQARRGFRAATCDIRPAELVIPVGSVEDGELPGPAGPLRTRTYRPGSATATAGGTDAAASETDTAAAGVPTVLFLHGGGWVIGDLDTHDNQARRICAETGSVVVSLDYRLAPEAPFPAAFEDAWAGLLWVAEHVAELGGDAGRIAVCGDSAGGNLAAALALRARDAGGPALAAQLLLYPGVDFSGDRDGYPSRVENAAGKLLTAADMIWFAEHYVGAPRDADPAFDLAQPYLSPLHGDLAGLAPAVVVVAEYDPLRDEGVAFAEALEKAGTPVELAVLDGMIHGFFDLAPVSPGVAAAVDRTISLFAEALHRRD